MRLRFTKMHGCGNDFVMIDAISQRVNLSADKVQTLADRHFGVGCDQVLVVEAPRKPQCDFRYRIYNQDGSEVENCGNGARCFALFVRQLGLTAKTTILVETAAGELSLHVGGDNRVTVNMGVPVLEPAAVPFQAEARALSYPLQVGERQLDISAVSMGNPHAVTLVDDVECTDVATLGAQIERHPRFPQRVNAGFLQILSPSRARLRVYERGVGETLACGTGACAALVSGRLRGLLEAQASIALPGGELSLAWEGEGKPVMMTGPATTVFHGQITI